VRARQFSPVQSAFFQLFSGASKEMSFGSAGICISYN
jgi:hypothetical protein